MRRGVAEGRGGGESVETNEVKSDNEWDVRDRAGGRLRANKYCYAGFFMWSLRTSTDACVNSVCCCVRSGAEKSDRDQESFYSIYNLPFIFLSLAMGHWNVGETLVVMVASSYSAYTNTYTNIQMHLCRWHTNDVVRKSDECRRNR